MHRSLFIKHRKNGKKEYYGGVYKISIHQIFEI